MVRELKHTEIGDIPVDWELQTFDETFRVISNNTLSRENLNNRGGAVRNIHYGDILTKFPEVLDCNEEEIPYVNELSLLSSSTQLLQDGDIVVADTAEDETVGKVIEVQNLGDSKLVAGLHTIPCRVKKGEFAPGWLGYYMNSDLFHNQILPYITGIKVSSISKGAISETLILVPPFDEQKKIVQSLNKIQLLMTAETKVVNKIKLVKKGCLSKMFPQKGDTVPEMRLPGFTEAWEQRKLIDLVDVLDGDRGKNYPTSDDFDISGHTLFLNATNVTNDGFLFQDNQFITEEKSNSMGNGKLEEDDIVVTSRGSLGHIAWYNADISSFMPYVRINSGMLILRNKKELETEYLYHFMKSDKGQSQISFISFGSAQPQLTKKGVENLEVVLPTRRDEQAQLGHYFSSIDHLINLHQCKCDKYSNIKKGMMSDLLTGEIRLV